MGVVGLVTQYLAQVGLPHKDRAIKGLVVCNDRNVKPLDLLIDHMIKI